MSIKTVVSTSPQNPEDVVISVAVADAATVRAAAEKARQAQREWWGMAPAQRGAALSAAADEVRGATQELIALTVRETGKPLAEATGEVARGISILDYYAQSAHLQSGTVLPSPGNSLLFTQRRPHGLAGLITPWNFPIAIPLWKAAPALISGNGVLLKPSPDATACALLVGELVGRHLPDGLFSVLPGGEIAGSEIVEAADVVSFTGSVMVGGAVRAAATARGIPVQCEMGGQNAAIVLPGADAAQTAKVIANAAMGFAGQKCTATSRVIVVGEQADFVAALVAEVAALEPADPAAATTVVGPVISSAARQRVLDAVEDAKASGARLLTGAPGVDGDGWFVRPVLLDEVPDDHRVAVHETFGPLALLQHVDTLDAAVQLCNAVPYGLVTSIHGPDLDALLNVGDNVDTGMVKLNAPSTGVDFYAPFGGQKASSYGQREQGVAALDYYSWTRTVTIAPHLA